jgi:hypothetical protein
MPAWPLPPLVVVLFTGFAIATQQQQYLLGEAVLSAGALVFWAVWHYRWRQPATAPSRAVAEEVVLP